MGYLCESYCLSIYLRTEDRRLSPILTRRIVYAYLSIASDIGSAGADLVQDRNTDVQGFQSLEEN